ncbi:hypothetical protein [Hyalangium rubrum]|uniref:Lipoprotein n=1 Tax=Hyalangium rubrum TaxID=3103134 RepID=A0ABU5HFD5_9BACT|nr:hypothetical protein [Hyalangium sp. s54d21]MDY7231975.1 hypothetical protein [Hyalangium sp. s54d21]
MSASRFLLVSLCASLGACAARQAASLQSYSLGMARAEYRDYVGARVPLCDTEPRWLSDELSSVNGLLARFLSGTEQAANPEALQHSQHLGLLQEATRTLEPVMKIHRQNLKALGECGFHRTGAFPELTRRGTELLEQVKARMSEAPSALAAAELRRAQRRWVEEAPAREASARQTWCTPLPTVGNADLYFARETNDGRTEWLFCDGLRVAAPAEGEPQLITPEGLSKRDRRRIQPQRYLDAAKAYPASEIDRLPDAAASSGGASAGQAVHAD